MMEKVRSTAMAGVLGLELIAEIGRVIAVGTCRFKTTSGRASFNRQREGKLMRIVVHGQQAFGKAVLEALLARGETIVGVFCAPDKKGVDPLKELALAKGLPVHQPVSWKDPAAAELLKSLDADLCVMAYVTLFVPSAALNTPRFGTIQYHPSLLPMHRGPSSINWPIIQGAKKTGLTIFWPDDGLDEGPILLQKEVTIGPDDTLGSIYFDKLFPMGVAAMLEGVDLVKAGTAPKIVQDLSKGSYESWCRKDDARIDWSKPAQEVYNLIRGTNPQPGAWTTLGGKVLDIYDSTLAEGQGKPGEVVRTTADSFTVAARGGAILVKRVKPEGAKKMDAGQLVAETRMRPGLMLGS
jgi:methionyl-tRNA formyltransferase